MPPLRPGAGYEVFLVLCPAPPPPPPLFQLLESQPGKGAHWECCRGIKGSFIGSWDSGSCFLRSRGASCPPGGQTRVGKVQWRGGGGGGGGCQVRSVEQRMSQLTWIGAA